ncbi:MAG: hypothetical protein HYY06_08910 [Deltaproteobacteria bacterium]|nr:hypothetical protein [Deltaproteobacteria bacterium]
MAPRLAICLLLSALIVTCSSSRERAETRRAPDAGARPEPAGRPRPRIAAYERETLVAPQVLPAAQVIARIAKQSAGRFTGTDAYRLVREAFLGEDLAHVFDAAAETALLEQDLASARQLGARYGETVIDPIAIEGAPLPLVRVELRGWAATNLSGRAMIRAMAETHSRLEPARADAEASFRRAWRALLPELERLTGSGARDLAELGRLTRFVARSSTYRVVVPFALEAEIAQELRPTGSRQPR